MTAKPQILDIKAHDNRQMKDPVSKFIESLPDSVSPEELQALLYKMEQTFDSKSKKETVRATVKKLAADEWSSIEKSMVEEFEFSLARDKEDFRVRASLDELLNRYIGEEKTAKFFEVLDYCLKNKSFTTVSKFYKNVDKTSQAIGRVAFAVYRLSAINFSKETFMGRRKDLNYAVKEALKSFPEGSSPFNVDKFTRDLEDAQLTQSI